MFILAILLFPKTSNSFQPQILPCSDFDSSRFPNMTSPTVGLNTLDVPHQNTVGAYRVRPPICIFSVGAHRVRPPPQNNTSVWVDTPDVPHQNTVGAHRVRPPPPQPTKKHAPEGFEFDRCLWQIKGE